MAVLGSSIPIASFYCRKQHIFCCCGDITPKFGDFNSIPLPAPVADLQFKDALIGVMDKINHIQRYLAMINCALGILSGLGFPLTLFVIAVTLALHDVPRVDGEWLFPFFILLICASVGLSWGLRHLTSRKCRAVVEESNGQSQDQGLFLEWVDNYNGAFFSWGNRRNSQRNAVSGFDLRMNGPKRQEYCAANGLPFDAVIYANPIWSQNQGLIPKEKDFDVYVGTRVELPPGAANVQYVMSPNVQVNPYVAPHMADSPYFAPPLMANPPSAHPYLHQAPPPAHPYLHQAPPSAHPYTHQAPLAAHPYNPQAPPSAHPYASSDAPVAPPPYSETQSSKS